FGIKVEKFYLFFDAWGYKLFSFKKGDTEYGIGWLPLGGYVKIAGMIDESMDTDQLKSEPQPWEFRSKPAWQRLIVMIGGVTVNFLVGFIVFILSVWHYGDTRLPIDKLQYGIHALEIGKEIGLKDGDIITGVNGVKSVYTDELLKPSVFLNDGNSFDVLRDGQTISLKLPKNIIDRISDKKGSLFSVRMPSQIDSVLAETPAAKANLKKGDKIIAVNDTTTEYYHEVSKILSNYADKQVKLKILRATDTIIVSTKLTKEGKLGFTNRDPYANDYVTTSYSFAESVPVGSNRAMEALTDNLTGLKKLVTGKVDPRKSVQGPIGIATMFGSTWVWERFWALTGLLSLILAFMNLLPIPALDGGHVVFLIVEMIIRRPLSDKFMSVMQVIGMILLLSLMVFAFGNDLYKIIFK
ncbi:MAG: RIP metalloprotease RseP, partial [Bacteroidetes bacterium]|nr:RIP metalloprotease RseP [Bacteroidota bacterium]